VGHRIRVPEVRVVLDNGEQRGIMPTREAQALAEEMGLELVEISPRSRPPVCRIMDYGKFKYQQSMKKSEQKARPSTVELKEFKFQTTDKRIDPAFCSPPLAVNGNAESCAATQFRSIPLEQYGQVFTYGNDLGIPGSRRDLPDRVFSTRTVANSEELAEHLHGFAFRLLNAPAPSTSSAWSATSRAAQTASSLAAQRGRVSPAARSFFLSLEDELLARHAPRIAERLATSAAELPAKTAVHFTRAPQNVEAHGRAARHALAEHDRHLDKLKRAL